MNIDHHRGTFLASKVIPTLRGQYNSIDIRGICARNQQNPEWHCVFLKVYFTKDSKDAIESIHKQKSKLISVKEDNLKFVSEGADITQATRLLEQVNDMKVQIDGLSAELHPLSQNLFESKKLDRNEHVLELYMAEPKLNGYTNAFISIDSTETPFETLARYGFNTKDHAYRNLHVDINTFLDTNNLGVTNSNGIIIFPIYWKKLKLDSSEQLEHITRFEIDSSLLTHCNLAIYSLKDGTAIGRIDSSKLQKYQTNDMTIFSVSLKDINVQQYSTLRIEADLPELEINLGYKLSYDEIVSKDKIQSNPLSFVFKLLSTANSNLELYVNSDYEKRQVVGTTWLLSMLGFIHMNFGIINSDDERLYDGRTTKGATDTIAFDGKSSILAIDATNSPPKEEKIDKIRNSAAYINEKLSLHVTPMIVCNKRCPETKDAVSDVVIIDKDDTDKLIELLSSNKTDGAKQLFHSRIHHSISER